MIHQNRRRTKTKLIERVGIFLFSGFFWGGGCGRGVEGGEILFCSEKVIPFTCCRRVNPRHFFVRLPITPSHAETHEAFLRGGARKWGSTIPQLPGPLSSSGAGFEGSGFLHLAVPAVKSLHREGARKDHECQPMSN